MLCNSNTYIFSMVSIWRSLNYRYILVLTELFSIGKWPWIQNQESEPQEQSNISLIFFLATGIKLHQILPLPQIVSVGWWEETCFVARFVWAHVQIQTQIHDLPRLTDAITWPFAKKYFNHLSYYDAII